MREITDPNQLKIRLLRDKKDKEQVLSLHAGLSLPSYVHGYSIAIEYMVDWFQKNIDKMQKNYFKGGIYVDGKHVLDDYKRFSKNVIVGQNPRARVEPRLDYDFDREFVDMYGGTPDILIRRSDYNKSFFRDYDRDLFLGMNLQAMRMQFNFKIRVNTRAQQLDLYNAMKMVFKIGATQYEDISMDFHIPRSILLNVAEKAAFDIDDKGNIVEPLEFVEYLNRHSDVPFLFKMRAINQRPEFFIRLRDLYTHISTRDKLQVDDGERDGKLDFNYHVEMATELTIPVPAYYICYSGDDFKVDIDLHEHKPGMVAVYTFNDYEIPKLDHHGWDQVAYTEYMTDDYEEYVDLSQLFTGNNVLGRAINLDLTKGVSPFHFMNLVVYRNTAPALCKGKLNWDDFKYYFDKPEKSQVLSIVVYMDRTYTNDLEISESNYKDSRLNRQGN